MRKKTNRNDKTRAALGRADTERLLSGRSLESEGWDELVAEIEALGRLGESVPTEAEAQRFAVQAAKLVPPEPGKPRRAAAETGARRSRGRRLVPALAAGAAVVVVLASATAGVAHAADGAVPGDTLYGVDLAFETIGIGDGGLEERLTEASQLVERGRAQEGLDHASDAIAQSAPEDQGLLAAAETLRAAAETAIENRSLGTPEELGQAAERLRLMATGDKTAEELGRAVDDLAGSLDSGSSKGGGQNQNGAGDEGGAGEEPPGPPVGNGSSDGSDGGSAAGS